MSVTVSDSQLDARRRDLINRFGADLVRVDDDALVHYGRDWTRAWPPRPTAIVLPRTVDQVVDLVQWANDEGVPLVPSGGRTGLSGGAVASQGEVVVALDRMNRILAFDPVDRLVTCEAGVVTAQLQQFAEDQGLFYPVDFASSGSSQIGGNIATNAGGIKVIRYGMTRNWVQGLTVVTGRGEVLKLNHGLIKNATGYDFRHLFIGAEGTLGIVVEATLALTTPPRDPTVLLLAVPQMEATMSVLQIFQQRLTLNAFEFFSERALGHVMAEKQLPRPVPTVSDFYALLEFENSGTDTLDEAMSLFESCLEQGLVEDGVMSQDAGQVAELWRYREDISETISRFTPYKNDISVRVPQVPAFLAEVEALVNDRYPTFELIWFGHIGDGNVHLNILKPDSLDRETFFAQCGSVSEEVFAVVQRHGGSISAEHGVGLLKKPYLTFSRSAAELAGMRAVKQVFDPNGIMNPGKIFDL